VIAALARRFEKHRQAHGAPQTGFVFLSRRYDGEHALEDLNSLLEWQIKPRLDKAGLEWHGWHAWPPPGKPERDYTVVGVVANSVYVDVHAPFAPELYIPFTQTPYAAPDTSITFLVRSRVGITGLLAPIKNTITGVSPEIDIQLKLLRTQIRDSLVQDELMATLCGFFGWLAVLQRRHYSCRSATIGSTLAARRAGINVAISDTAATIEATQSTRNGVCMRFPFRSPERRLGKGSARRTPVTHPIPVISPPCRSINHNMSARPAPRAVRIPISCVRRLTE
jgi:hypothetical protein